MEETVKNYLRENLDENIKILNNFDHTNLPLFLIQKYNFNLIQLLNKKILLVEPSENNSTIIELKKHMRILYNLKKDNVVFLFKQISQYKRKLLIKEKIPFIVENGQFFLPFLGLDLSNQTRENLKTVEEFTPVTQQVYLWFLYNKEGQLTSEDLSLKFNYSKMHIFRALNILCDLNLLVYKIGGKTKRSKIYKRIDDPSYYLNGKEYLKNPVNKVVYLKKIDNKYPAAGLYALAKISMLNPPDQKIYAISKSEAKRIQTQFIENIDRINNEKLNQIQIWNYNPDNFQNNGIVDLLSLSLSINHLHDERVEMSIEQKLRSEKWYME